MNENSNFAYRSASAEGATYTDLLLLVYDAIARDLLQAGQAAERMHVEARCRHVNHALLLLGHVESWISFLDDPMLGSSLVMFYDMLRTRLLQLQRLSSSKEFEDLASLVCDTRAAWQRKQQSLLEQPAAGKLFEAGFSQMSTDKEPVRSAWSA